MIVNDFWKRVSCEYLCNYVTCKECREILHSNYCPRDSEVTKNESIEAIRVISQRLYNEEWQHEEDPFLYEISIDDLMKVIKEEIVIDSFLGDEM